MTPDEATGAPRLQAVGLTTAYDDRVVSKNLDLALPDGGFTAVVGPNACGKSTLLRHLARLAPPRAGSVVLDGRDIASYRPREVARRLGLLPQGAVTPDGMTVAELVARGRYPHQGLLRQWSADDEAAVADALAATGLSALATRGIDELSGGQRQRAWVALVLAQQTDLVLLDEPTTYLDVVHQVELLELLTDLQHRGRTLVAVLHDLNQAARYASHLVAMRDGQVVAAGDPRKILTADLVEDVFGLPCVVVPDPVTGTPAVFPLGRRRAGRRTPSSASR